MFKIAQDAAARQSPAPTTTREQPVAYVARLKGTTVDVVPVPGGLLPLRAGADAEVIVMVACGALSATGDRGCASRARIEHRARPRGNQTHVG